MQTYSHIIVTEKLLDLIKPEDEEAFYFGAVFPDIRYYNGMKRAQTHISLEEVKEMMDKYPSAASFLEGYFVHLSIDDFSPVEYVYCKYPLRPLRYKLGRAPMILEFFVLRDKKLTAKVSGEPNEATRALGIKDEDVRVYGRELNRFLTDPGLDSGLIAAENLGMLDLPATEKYVKTINAIRKYGILNRLLYSLTCPDYVLEAAAHKVVEDLYEYGLVENRG